MTDKLYALTRLLLIALPFLLFAFLDAALNLRKKNRNRQFCMPVIAAVYCVIVAFFLRKLGNTVSDFVTGISSSEGFLKDLVSRLDEFCGLEAFLFVLLNTLVLLAYLILKAVLLPIQSKLFSHPGGLAERVSGIYYEYDSGEQCWYIQKKYEQVRVLLRNVFIWTVILSTLAGLVSSLLVGEGRLTVPYYPVFVVIAVGELFFYTNGLSRKDENGDEEFEEDGAERSYNYAVLCNHLRRLFRDRLNADGTGYTEADREESSHEALLESMEEQESFESRAYAAYIRRKCENGAEINVDYVGSGLSLIKGKSVLFHNPFYHDLTPYIFFPMHHVLLRKGRALVITGRHGIEQSAYDWCREGLQSISGLPDLWSVELLTETEEDRLPQVGILSRSAVNDLAFLEANRRFLSQVEFVILLEPSQLITTAQVGLSSVARICSQNQKPVYCSVDKNCDGLVDALSHALRTDLVEVAATSYSRSNLKYMCWDVDHTPLQHRMLGGISRFLGFGTEVTFVALKDCIDRCCWYGGDAFPVIDMQWIARQYHRELLNYAGLPAGQDQMDEHFEVSPEMWSAPVSDDACFQVEDEAFNMFETERAFSTRVRKDGLVNVFSTQYLLKDYMAENHAIFHADPKAVPYISADFDRTKRNIALQLCLRMSVAPVSESDVEQEIKPVTALTGNLSDDLWRLIYDALHDRTEEAFDASGLPVLWIAGHRFTSDILTVRKKYNWLRESAERFYSMKNDDFNRLVLGDIHSAAYITEDSDEENRCLGRELVGQIFQKLLPGQYITLKGKYYEMLRLTSDGQVLLRRAAEHINHRFAYRQIRSYRLANMRSSEVMGEKKDFGLFAVERMSADISVDTAGYWQLENRQNFDTAKCIEVSGIPSRRYINKQLLVLTFPDVSPRVLRTFSLLIQEIFLSLFAENLGYLAVVTPGDVEIPQTYTVETEDETSGRIYIVEDSYLDIGLLTAVERNLMRIFRIVYDYLDWNEAFIKKSIEEETKKPPEKPKAPETAPEEEPASGKKKKSIWERIREWFRKIFRKLFKKRKKKESEPTESAETPAEDVPVEEPPKEVAGDTSPAGSDDPKEEKLSQFESTALASPSAEQTVPDETGKDSLSFEEEDAELSAGEITRKPYHKRYYLLYGGKEIPSWMDIAGTVEFLRKLGCEDNQLTRARRNKDIAAEIEAAFVPGKQGVMYCDFCGCELSESGYETLRDGRQRCLQCGKTAVNSAERFKRLHANVVRNMQNYFGVRIDVPMHIRMVSSTRLHKLIGKSFVPTGDMDGRVLGVAIRGKDGYTILLENGAPAVQASMTMVHEMTHIWQYLNWDEKKIKKTYGDKRSLEIYEGMAKWVEIQYAYLIGEAAAAKREEIISMVRDDEYGRGFRAYLGEYPLHMGATGDLMTPFTKGDRPLG